MTNLPASEESFSNSKPQRTLRLNDIITGDGVSTLSSFACVMVLTALFGRNLLHIQRPQPNDNEHDLNGEFWKRHRSHDNSLLHIALSLPDHLRLPSGMSDVNVVFANMSIHTSTICLHQIAIFKAEKNNLPNQISTESKRRCLVAANQISSTMKMISHMELTSVSLPAHYHDSVLTACSSTHLCHSAYTLLLAFLCNTSSPDPRIQVLDLHCSSLSLL